MTETEYLKNIPQLDFIGKIQHWFEGHKDLRVEEKTIYTISYQLPKEHDNYKRNTGTAITYQCEGCGRIRVERLEIIEK